MNLYGYKHQRGPGPGCQPNDFIEISYEETQKHYGQVLYNRKLTKKEKDTYDLELIKDQTTIDCKAF